MGKGKNLSPTKRAQILAYSRSGRSQRDIAALLGVSKTSVQQALAKFDSSGSFKDARRSGRPRKTTIQDDRIVRRLVKAFPKISAHAICSELKNAGVNVHRSTVSRRLKGMNLSAYKPAKKPRLTEEMKRRRLAFANRYKHWTVSDWRKVMWSDECSFLQFGQYASHVRRPRGQRYVEKYTIATVKHPPTIMVWGCMSSFGRGCLTVLNRNERIDSKRYIELMENKLKLFMTIHQCEIFMQDSAPCHVSKASLAWFQKQKIRLLEWPGNSPDLNPIENVWRCMKGKVSSRCPKSLPELQYAIRQVWTLDITRELCRNCIDSMPRRLKSVIENRGGPTKY